MKNTTDQKTPEDYRESVQKHIREAKSEWKIFGKTGIFTLAVLGAAAFLGLAWFVSNNSVNSLLGGISASDEMQYVLACTGDRMETEQDHLLTQNEGEPLTWGDSKLSMGLSEHHDRYIDVATGETVEKKADYYTQKGEFAWCLPNAIRFYPGARGELEMYLIPRVDGLTSVQLQLELMPYKAQEDGNGKIGAVPQEDETLAKLLNGHVLLFRTLDDNAGYSDWMGEEHTITVENKGQTLIKDMPYKIKIYWVWPKQYRNLIYDKYSTRGDIFSSTENNPDYDKLITYINEHKDYFFYSANSETIFPETSDQMNQEKFDQGVLVYNQADEYIGMNADYLYVCVNAE